MSFEEKFARAEGAGADGIFERIDDSSPVGVFLGIEQGQRAVMVVCPQRPPDPPSLASIHMEARARQGGDWALVLRLRRGELKALFNRLVEDLDLILRARPERPGEVVLGRIERWKRLMSGGTPGLDERELRGLVAELLFLSKEAIPARGITEALKGWVGPFGAAKDFEFSDVEIEVKALHRGQGQVVISSLEQLTLTGVPMYLWCQVVELRSGGREGDGDLGQLVASLRRVVADAPAAGEWFERALQAAGYEDDADYVRQIIDRGTSICFRVEAGFPRLERTLVAPAITGCRYTLELQQIESFKTRTWGETDAR